MLEPHKVSNPTDVSAPRAEEGGQWVLGREQLGAGLCLCLGNSCVKYWR